MHKFENNSITIIMYHYVRNLKNSKYPNLKAFELSNFRKQIKYLNNKYNVLRLDQLLQILKDRKIPKKPSILLSFDDGYTDHLQVGEYLSKYNLEGFFYIVGSACKAEKMMDVNKIHFIMEKEQDTYKLIKLVLNYYKKFTGSELNLKLIKKILLKEKNYNYFDNFDVFFLKCLLRVGIKTKVRQKILNKLFKDIINDDEKSFAKKLYLNKKQIIEMKNCGMNFGIHGYEHMPLGYLNKSKQKEQFDKSINFIKFVKQKIEHTSVCYPNGVYNKNTLKLMKQYNFAFGLTTNPGLVNHKNISNKLELPRIDVTKISF